MGNREVTTKENFFAVQLKEGENVILTVQTVGENAGDEQVLAFVVPYDCVLNSYIKKPTIPLQFHRPTAF